MKISTCSIMGTPVINIEGSLSSEYVLNFQSVLDDIYESGSNVILDVSGLEYVDSSALGIIIKYHNRFEGDGKKFVLVKVSREVEEMLRVTGLYDRINMFINTASALDFIAG